MARGIIQLTDGRGRKYLTAEERERFLATAARVFLSRMWGEGPAPRSRNPRPCSECSRMTWRPGRGSIGAWRLPDG